MSFQLCPYKSTTRMEKITRKKCMTWKLISDVFFVHMIIFNVSCNTTTPQGNKCAHSWKLDLGSTNRSTQPLEDLFLELEKSISGFLSSQNTDTSMKVILEACARNDDCRIFTLLDKAKKESLLLCITIQDTETCYTSTCSFKANRDKRAIETVVKLNETRSDQHSEKLKDTDLFCEFKISNVRYTHDRTIDNCCQNNSRNVIFNKNNDINEGTSTFKEEYICHQQIRKENNPVFYVIFSFGGAILGLCVGVCVTYAYLKRISRHSKSLLVSKEMNIESNTVVNGVFNDTTEYSEIPYTLDNFEAEKTLLTEEKRNHTRGHSGGGGSQNRRFETLHASPSLIVQVDMFELTFQDDIYPTQKLQEGVEYVEPMCQQYHHLTHRESKSKVTLELHENKDRNDLTNREASKAITEAEYPNTNVLKSDVKMQDVIHEYHHLNECSTLNTGLNLPQKEIVGKSNKCTSKDGHDAGESAYFVLSAISHSTTEEYSDEVKVREVEILTNANTTTEQNKSGSEYLNSLSADVRTEQKAEELYFVLSESL